MDQHDYNIMVSCLFAAGMQFTCEIWEESSQQDPETGQFIRKWKYLQTTKCGINQLPSTSKRAPAIEVYGKEKFDYDSFMYIVMPISPLETSRITNIKAKSGEVLYNEPTGLATIFEIAGKQPLLDGAFGNVLGYEIFAGRSEVQEMDNDN